MELDKPIINENALKLNYTNEGGINNNVRFLKNIMGLWINQECKRHWEKIGEHISFDDLMAALNAQPFKATSTLMIHIFFEPGNMPAKYRILPGLNQKTSDKGSVRCVMESLALKYRYVIEGLERLSVKNFKLHIVGGGCKNTI